jgi:hypothetical protein
MPSSPIIARADALMQRRRQNPGGDDVPLLTDAVDLPKVEPDDDIPVLHHIEASEAQPLPRPPSAPTLPPPRPAAATQESPFSTLSSKLLLNREDIAHDIAHRVEKRLIAELPNLIATAVADYLAEQDGAH